MGIVHTVGVAPCARPLLFLLHEIAPAASDLIWFFAIMALLISLGCWYLEQRATPTLGMIVKDIFGIELFSHHTCAVMFWAMGISTTV